MNSRSTLFLIANLGSEITKIFSAKKTKNHSMLETALKNAESIISELKNISETRDNKEVDILGDIVQDFKEVKPKYDIPREDFEAYFYPFALKLLSTNKK